MTRFFKFATAAIVLFSACPAFAGTEVRYDSDKLGNPAYVEVVYDRIVEAAELECRRISRMTNNADYGACLELTIADAVEKVGAPLLSSYAAGEEGFSLAAN